MSSRFDVDVERSRFVERFALLLSEAGLARMPARVLAYVLASDAETHTAAELAAGLRVSPAAISGAVRMLVDIRVLAKERTPGERADRYRIAGDDVPSVFLARQQPIFRFAAAIFADGIRLIPQDRPGGRRIHQTREFYQFLEAQYDELLQRWRERQAGLPDVTDSPGAGRVRPAG